MDTKYAFCNSDCKMYYLNYNFNSTYHICTMLIILFAKLIILCVRNRKQGQKLISIFTYHNKKYPKTEILPFYNLKKLIKHLLLDDKNFFHMDLRHKFDLNYNSQSWSKEPRTC